MELVEAGKWLVQNLGPEWALIVYLLWREWQREAARAAYLERDMAVKTKLAGIVDAISRKLESGP